MWSQTSDEEGQERNEEIDNDYYKSKNFPKSIIGRKRLRNMRYILRKLNVHLRIPMNSARITDEYCLKHGKDEPDTTWWA